MPPIPVSPIQISASSRPTTLLQAVSSQLQPSASCPPTFRSPTARPRRFSPVTLPPANPPSPALFQVPIPPAQTISPPPRPRMALRFPLPRPLSHHLHLSATRP